MKSTEKWLESFHTSVSDTISLIQKEYLDHFNLKAVLVKNHDFTGPEKSWYGSYLREKNMIQKGIICFSLNIPLIRETITKMGKSKDIQNIKMQAKVLTAHEIAHGIIDYLRLIKYPLQFKSLSEEEEYAAQEFGLSFAPEYTNITHSLLKNILYEMKKGQE